MRRFLPFALLLTAACGGSTPAAPTAPSLPATPVETRFVGQIVDTVTRAPLGSVAVTLGTLNTLSSSSGAFEFEWENSTATTRMSLSGINILDRSLLVSVANSRMLTVDAIVLGNGFDLGYYRRFARRGLDQPDSLLSLRRWTHAPRLYLKTVDEAGNPVDNETLRQTEMALADEALAWTGGSFGLAEIVRGTGTQEGSAGWVTIKWPNPAIAGNVCGQAQVALEGGWIELNYLNSNCGCSGSRVGAGIVRHELGHTMGFYHTDEPGDLLTATLSRSTACAGRPSARERLHAAIAYNRPVGNLDPDTDPGTIVHSFDQRPIVIVD